MQPYTLRDTHTHIYIYIPACISFRDKFFNSAFINHDWHQRAHSPRHQLIENSICNFENLIYQPYLPHIFLVCSSNTHMQIFVAPNGHVAATMALHCVSNTLPPLPFGIPAKLFFCDLWKYFPTDRLNMCCTKWIMLWWSVNSTNTTMTHLPVTWWKSKNVVWH